MKTPFSDQPWMKWISSQPLWLRLLILFSAGALAVLILVLVLAPPGFSTDDPGDSTMGGFSVALDLILKLSFIIILIFVTLGIFSKLRSNTWVSQNRKLQIIETTNLSQRQVLHIIQIGKKRYLIGATDASISLLTELESEEGLSGNESAFAESLQQELAGPDQEGVSNG